MIAKRVKDSGRMLTAIVSKRDYLAGAAKASYRLHKGLNLIGMESFMLVKEKKAHDDKVLQVVASEGSSGSEEKNIIQAIQRRYIDENRTPLTNTKFTFPYPGYDLSGLEIVKQADIINLHFIASFQSCETIRKLLLSGKSVVWTLHDQWALTGGCHYSAGCEKYKSDCLGCPQLADDPYQIPHKVLAHKRSLIDKSRLFIVTPSKWLSRVAKESLLFGELMTEVIPNAVETDLFRPGSDKGESKERLGIPADVITMLFGSASGNIKRKGLEKLRDALEICNNNRKFKKLVIKEKIKVLCFGTPGSEIMKLRIPCRSFGTIAQDDVLRDIYDAADLMVLPSLEDNLPNTLLEAMSCGTPPVAFAIGGMPDVIVDQANGRLVSPFDADLLAEAIMDLVFDAEKRKKLGSNSRELMKNHFHLREQARKYLDFFAEISSRRGLHPSSNFVPPDRKLISELDRSLPAKYPSLYAEFSTGQPRR